jgi:hypothetical protein
MTLAVPFCLSALCQRRGARRSAATGTAARARSIGRTVPFSIARSAPHSQYREHSRYRRCPSAIGLGRSLPCRLVYRSLQQCSAPQQQRCGNEPRTAACVGLCAEGTKDGVHVDVTFYKPFSKAPLVFTTIQGSADGHQFATVGPQRFVKSTVGTRHPPPAASSPPVAPPVRLTASNLPLVAVVVPQCAGLTA